ncbi:Transmembrane protein [Quillaja saponaria]|uniref:Transmembrane protein n=1 Tax=Quillaja saponaria TaxID=32244 RepID=A0AAD7M241_QUISA|nr:Transmembrane protein [Quillaja saponaria]
MEMTEIPKLDLTTSSFQVSESEPNMATQKISVSDHVNGFHYPPEKPDNFVIDMDSFSHTINKDSNANSRITRTLSRKGSQRGGDKKINSNITLNDRDTLVATSSPKVSPVGSSMQEKPVVVAVAGGTTDHTNSQQVHHQITISAGSIGTTTTDSRCISRRNSFRRVSWGFDPKRVLFLFATLSSMGTILLIYFTLSLNKHYADEYGTDWQQ